MDITKANIDINIDEVLEYGEIKNVTNEKFFISKIYKDFLYSKGNKKHNITNHFFG